MKKYRTDDVTALSKIITKLSKLKLKKKDNPEELEDDITAIKSEYRSLINKKTKHDFVVKAAGKNYADIIC